MSQTPPGGPDALSDINARAATANHTSTAAPTDASADTRTDTSSNARDKASDRTSDRASPTRPRRPRGPSADKTAHTQQQIAHAALALFVQHGIARTTMAQIAARAQVAKGSLYRYYPSKDALLRGVVEHALRQSAPNVPITRQPGETVHALLRRSVLPTLHALASSERGDLARLLLSEARQQPELARLYKTLAFDPWQRHVVRLLQLAVDEGELHTPSVAACGQLLASPFWMDMVRSGLPGTDADADTHNAQDVATLTSLLLDSLFAVPAPAQ